MCVSTCEGKAVDASEGPTVGLMDNVPQGCGLWGQVKKRIRWMPWRPQAMKDVIACEKLRGVGKQALIRRSLNGETHPRGYPNLNS